MPLYDVETESGKTYEVETETAPSTRPSPLDLLRSVSGQAARPLTALVRTPQTGQAPHDPLDPLGLKSMAANIPAPSITLPIMGGVFGSMLGELPGGVVGAEGGTLLGRELQRARDEAEGKPSEQLPFTGKQVVQDLSSLGGTVAGAYLPEVSVALKAFPFAQTLTTGLGAASGDILGRLLTRQKPSGEQAVSSGAQAAAVTGLVSAGLKAAHAAPEFLRANKMRLQMKVGQSDTTHALEREGFIQSVRQDVDRTIDRSGEAATNKVNQLSSVKAPQIASTMQELIQEDPKLQKAILKSSDELGEGAFIRQTFPELTVSVERGAAPADTVVAEGRQSFQQKILQHLMGSGQLPAGEGMEMTGAEAQRLKKVLRGVFGEAMNRRHDLTFTERNALRLYGEVKEALLGADPTLKEDFQRHTDLMTRYRQVQRKLKDLDKLESAIEQWFGGSSSQVAFQKLLSPQVLEQAMDFARANNISKVSASFLWRALRFAAMLPIYAGATAMRSGVRSALR